jgi:hypothetical protein
MPVGCHDAIETIHKNDGEKKPKCDVVFDVDLKAAFDRIVQYLAAHADWGVPGQRTDPRLAERRSASIRAGTLRPLGSTPPVSSGACIAHQP